MVVDYYPCSEMKNIKWLEWKALVPKFYRTLRKKFEVWKFRGETVNDLVIYARRTEYPAECILNL